MSTRQLRKTVVILIVGICLLGSIGAEEKARNLVNCEDLSEWEGMVKVNTQIKRSGKGSFELYGKYPTEIISSRMIPIDMNKSYTLSAWMRTLDKQLPASAFMGLRMYDENKKAININNVSINPGTETTLAVGVVKGAKELRIVKNAKWLNLKQNATWLRLKQYAVAFNAKAKYQDLPNFDISSQMIDVIDEGEWYRIILRKALNKAYPVGTKIRLHLRHGAPFHTAAYGWMPTEWKKFSATMKGEAQCGAPAYSFWRGTKYVRIFVWFGQYNLKPKKGARLLVDDIKFTSSP